MKREVKLGLLGAIIAGVFSACSSEPKSVEYYSDEKNAKELEAKIQECDKNANSAKSDIECENAYRANYGKSLKNMKNFTITDEEIAKHFKRNNNQKSQ